MAAWPTICVIWSIPKLIAVPLISGPTNSPALIPSPEPIPTMRVITGIILLITVEISPSSAAMTCPIGKTIKSGEMRMSNTPSQTASFSSFIIFSITSSTSATYSLIALAIP